MQQGAFKLVKERKNGQIGQTISAPPSTALPAAQGPPGRGEAGAAPAAAHPHQARPVQPGQDAPHLLLGAGEPRLPGGGEDGLPPQAAALLVGLVEPLQHEAGVLPGAVGQGGQLRRGRGGGEVVEVGGSSSTPTTVCPR